ncbi:MAG: Bax inhibitor-1/YccA family protein [Deltaproteobacteria bacterium]|nr:Bax inhibitor-1/YccA family protein [Deltaproteobacteria bacterium]
MARSFEQYSTGAVLGRDAAVVSAFMRRVYNWMAAGLALSGLLAWFTMNSPALLGQFITPEGPTMLFWIAIIGELGLVLGVSAGIRRLSVGTAIALFLAYSALNGLTLGIVLLAYTGASVAKTFLITAGTFAAVSLWATTTKRDLSGAGSFLMMGLIGIIIASVVNLFLRSPMMDWIVSLIGVGLFVGLTAYDTQRLRAMVLEAANEVTVSKMAVLGALTLYLDFINLFLFLLRFLGDRR